VSPAVIYVGVGVLLGPIGLAFVAPDFAHHGRLIEAVSETVLLFALFGAGLRLRLSIDWQCWRVPVGFAAVSMLATMLLIAAAAQLCFALDFPAALLLGAILAPTDSLLTAGVRLPPTGDDAGVRTLLTAESALATLLAVPAVLLALGLIGVHDLGGNGLSWITRDLVWSVAGGLALGWLSGAFTWRAFVRARTGRDGEFPEEIVAVATIALACAAAMILAASPLSAVFAAGLALSHGGRRAMTGRAERPTSRFQAFSARLEQIGAVAALLLLGALVHVRDFRTAAVIFALIVLVLVRPVAARLGLGLSPLSPTQQRVAAWFGMRGIVSVYLLSMAVNHGLNAAFARDLAGIVLVVLVTCVALQALSSTPLIGRRVDQRA
jgi:sodium/hydrogen antiporter